MDFGDFEIGSKWVEFERFQNIELSLKGACPRSNLGDFEMSSKKKKKSMRAS